MTPTTSTPTRRWRVRRKLLAEDAVLIGPLWPAPGAGRWDGGRMLPVTS